MSHKALTAAIAAALAAPMAAQAVDFTISGQINRALFITDSNAGTKGEVANNGGGSTRFRANGSSELADGSTVAIQLEYEEGNDGGTSGSQGIKMRHANIQYRGDFGAVTVGQGSEAADGSQFSDTTGVNGIGHGAGTGAGFSLGKYFGSLDGGGRTNMIRYDSPAIGPISAAVSVGNGDSVSGRLKLSTDVAGTAFGAQLAALRAGGGPSSIGASFGATLASGLTISGAWAKGTDVDGAKIAARRAYDPWRYTVNPAGNFNIVEGGTAQNLATVLGGIQAAQPGDAAAGVTGYDVLNEDNVGDRFANMDANGDSLTDGSALSDTQKTMVYKALEMGGDQCYGADEPGVEDVTGCSRSITLRGRLGSDGGGGNEGRSELLPGGAWLPVRQHRRGRFLVPVPGLRERRV